jgi:hypothetical protein
LDHISQTSLDEWNLKIDMGQAQENDGYYLAEFIRRLDAKIEEENDAMILDFSDSQVALSQTEEQERGMSRN